MLTQELCNLIKESLQGILAGRDQLSLKPDNSYVSAGDLLVQSIAQNWVSQYFPNHFFISEELSPFSQVNWDINGSYVVLDPIDGTENFISGLKEWGVGVSIYTQGQHQESCIYLPELDELQITGMPIKKYKSRIKGISSSLTSEDLRNIEREEGVEYRIIGCAMYNLLMAARGSYKIFENVKGVNCWDILPGINIALEAGCKVWVDGKPYAGEMLFPTKKFKVKIESN